MKQRSQIPDRVIQQSVAQQLTRHGIRLPSEVHVEVRHGQVFLSGKIEFEMQRKAAIHAATAVNGVSKVVDQMAVMRNTIGGWHTQHH